MAKYETSKKTFLKIGNTNRQKSKLKRKDKKHILKHKKTGAKTN